MRLSCGRSSGKPTLINREILRVAHDYRSLDVYLRTENPSCERVADAVEQILSKAEYRTRAKELSSDFATYDSAQDITRLLETLLLDHVPLDARV